MAGTCKRGKAVVEEEGDVNPRSKSRTRKQYSPYAQTKELSPPSEEQRRRHLLISNGGAICLLDLEHSKDKQPLINADYVPPLPIVASLKLKENHLPLLAALFKVGSDAYMIGGRKRIRARENQSTRPTKRLKTIRRLSLSASATDNNSNGNTLIITASKALTILTKKLKTPKLWPIVEEIDGQIHVLDSTFPKLWSKPRDWMFSHEVLNTKAAALGGHPRSSWRKIGVDLPPVLNKDFIKSHLVLGKHIYAVMARSRKHVVFNSETNKWEYMGLGRHQYPSRLCVHHVWDILDNIGFASCVAELPPYYVVIEISERRSHDDCNYYYMDLDGVYAEAFVVRGATGEVVWRQSLPRFFQGPVLPHCLQTIKVIKVDQEENTMCAILSAHAILNGSEYDFANYLFIYTFSVEILASADDVDEKRLDLEELVRVVPKQRFVYMTNARRQEEDKGVHHPDFTHFQAIQACFV